MLFVNIQKTTDGVTYEEKRGIEGSSSLSGGSGTKGYVNPLTCYIDLVVSAADNYTSECGDGFEAYAEYDLIETLADIADTYKETLKAEAKDKIAAYIAETYTGSSVAEAPVFKGEYLLTAKEQGRDFAKNNRYFVVFAVNVSSTENNFAPATVYFPVEFSGIVKLPGDEYMVYEKGGIVGHSDFPDSTYYTDGYLSGATMFSEIVTANREQYKYEVSEGLKEFGE